MAPPHGRKSSSFFPQGATFVQPPSRLFSPIDGASHNLRQRLYSSPQSNSPATLRTSLNKSFDIHAPLPITFRPHPNLYVVSPSNNVKLNHYSKPSFLETSRNFYLLRSYATTGNCKIINIPRAILLF